MSVTISGCAAADVDAVARFFDEEWKPGHILAASRALLDWQYRNPDGSYSFVIARQDGAIVGILGYISTKRYDAGLSNDNVVWLTTWKVRDAANVAALGIALLQHLAASEPHVAIGALGFTPASEPIYRALGYHVGELEHYVAYVTAEPAPTRAPLAGRIVADRSEFESLRLTGPNAVPKKTPRYFHDRYAAHPVYSYRVVALRDGAAIVGLLAARVAEHEGHRALRIVDFVGHPETFGRIGAAVQSLIREERAEYADMYNVGIDAASFVDAGFTRVDPDGAEIVPDHFEPFERRNVRLRYAIKSLLEPVLFKGDADQDRPNFIPGGAR